VRAAYAADLTERVRRAPHYWVKRKSRQKALGSFAAARNGSTNAKKQKNPKHWNRPL
jgi:hypothetical protein